MENFTTNLNQLARVGGIDPLIGRDKELERAIQVLCRRRKNNPLLVGESGVGKTAIAEGLAWRIVQGDVPEVIADCTIYSLDIERINLCIDELVNKGRTLMPIFDFHSRKRVEGQEKEIAISGDDVVIIEGLHGLNPLLTQRVGEDKVTRIFASVRSRFTDHDRVLLTPQDVRLMRRMVRDRSTRNTTPEQTMAMWDEVCEGESEYINPYRDSADFKLDTTLDYEPNIFHSYLLPFLENRSGIAPEHYRKLDELYQRLDEFFDINNTQAIPADSVVREFIGPRRESEQTE
mgnify:CR=1 FL=1